MHRSFNICGKPGPQRSPVCLMWGSTLTFTPTGNAPVANPHYPPPVCNPTATESWLPTTETASHPLAISRNAYAGFSPIRHRPGLSSRSPCGQSTMRGNALSRGRKGVLWGGIGEPYRATPSQGYRCSRTRLLGLPGRLRLTGYRFRLLAVVYLPAPPVGAGQQGPRHVALPA